MSTKRFAEEFKAEAVKQVLVGGHRVADVAARLGVSQHSLYAWIRKLPRQVDRLEVETAAVDNLGLNTTGGTLPRESCGRYSL